MGDLSLWGLFFSAFVAATLFPGGSEVALVAFAASGEHASGTLLGVATLGNTLGGLSSWLLGWLLAKRYPLEQPKKSAQQNAVAHIKKWGSPLLLLSWLPVVGDPLCFAAGWLQTNFLLATLFISLGKAARYAVVLSLM